MDYRYDDPDYGEERSCNVCGRLETDCENERSIGGECSPIEMYESECEECHGCGHVFDGYQCDNCDGTGLVLFSYL